MSNVTFEYLQKDNDLFGTDVLRAAVANTPKAFQPTIAHTNRQSANKLNNNQTIEAVVPQTRSFEGTVISTDAYKATFKFSALQHIDNDADANLAIDMVLAYIQAHRDEIIAGRKPLSANALVVATGV